jgi:hypothetical protein
MKKWRAKRTEWNKSIFIVSSINVGSVLLIGERLKGLDVHHAGVATHYVASNKVGSDHDMCMTCFRGPVVGLPPLS